MEIPIVRRLRGYQAVNEEFELFCYPDAAIISPPPAALKRARHYHDEMATKRIEVPANFRNQVLE